jgi:hypothetical protein
MEHQNGKWKTEFTAKPTSERAPDYIDETLCDEFPLQFPYGHTGLKGDPAVTELMEKKSENELMYFENCFNTESMFPLPSIQPHYRKI